MKYAILSGGKGTRLSELTGVVNKPLLEVGGIPLALHVVARYFLAGVKECHFLTGFRAESFTRALLEKRDLLLNHPSRLIREMCEQVSFIFIETPEDADTFERIKPILGSEPVMITYGDTLTNVDVNLVTEEWKTNSLISQSCVTRPKRRFSHVDWDKSSRLIRSFEEKTGFEPSYVGCGFIILSNISEFKDMVSFKSLESDVLPFLSKKGCLRAFEHIGLWHPIDYLSDLIAAERLWSEAGANSPIWLV
jgi:glucose-1-phosphate cytidylyltransferase